MFFWKFPSKNGCISWTTASLPVLKIWWVSLRIATTSKCTSDPGCTGKYRESYPIVCKRFPNGRSTLRNSLCKDFSCYKKKKNVVQGLCLKKKRPERQYLLYESSTNFKSNFHKVSCTLNSEEIAAVIQKKKKKLCIMSSTRKNFTIFDFAWFSRTVVKSKTSG